MKPLDLIANYKRRGYVLIAFTLSLMLLLGTAGLTFDVGRMYITKNEAQSYCDAAALYAVWKLNGKADGIAAARAAALATPKQWDFGTRPFDPSRTTVGFGKTYADPEPWPQNPTPATDYVYARVSTSVLLPMFLMPAATGVFQSTIAARATAKQLPLTGTPNNIFPFAPMWMAPGGNKPPEGSSAPTPPDPYGMTPARTGAASPYDLQQGGIYTLRGPSSLSSNPTMATAANDMCTNDATVAQEKYRSLSGQPDRGFIWDSKSTKDIKDAIQGNAVPQNGHSIDIGVNVNVKTNPDCDFCLVPGERQMATIKAIQDRVGSDTNATDPDYQTYARSKAGNSRRIVVVPMVTGTYQASPDWPKDSHGVEFGADNVIGFASFFLMTDGYYADHNKNATEPICAEYIGPWVPNSMGGGAGGGSGTTGGSVLMLVD